MFDKWLVGSAAVPQFTLKEQSVIGAAAAAFRLRRSEAPKATLETAVQTLKGLDRRLFQEDTEHAYRPELRHAIRMLKSARDAAGFEYASDAEGKLHRLAMRAMEHADEVIRYSTNALHRNTRPNPLLPAKEQTPIGRWRTFSSYLYFNRPLVGTLRPWAGTIAHHGVGNCLEFAAVAANWLRDNAPTVSSHLHVISGGDHVFTSATLGKHSYLIDPWAIRVYRWKDHKTELMNYTGQLHPQDASKTAEAKPHLAPLTDAMKVVHYNVFDF